MKRDAHRRRKIAEARRITRARAAALDLAILALLLCALIAIAYIIA